MKVFGNGYGFVFGRISALKALVNAFKARVLADAGVFEGEANLLNQNLANINAASFVYVPSAVKAGKDYALKPNNGSGDLTHARASVGFRNNQSNVLEQMGSNVGRIHYINGVPTLLIDPVRTNLSVRSEDLPNWIGLNQFCLTATNVADAPNNTTTADKLIADNSSNQHRVGQLVSLAASTYTISVFAKAAEYGYLSLGQGGGIAGGDVIFNLINGTIGGTNTSFVNPVITSVGNGWYRCSITLNVGGAGNSYIWMIVRDSNSSASYTGDNSKGILIWGTQIELGSFATSYIPTTTAAVTRVADNNSVTRTFTQAQTIFQSIYLNAGSLSDGGIYTIFDARLSTNSRITLYRFNNTIQIDVINTTNQYSGTVFTITSPAKDAIYKIAVTCTATVFKVFVNGALVYTSATLSLPNLGSATLSIGSFTTGVLQWNGSLGENYIYDYTMSDSEAILRTT